MTTGTASRLLRNSVLSALIYMAPRSANALLFILISRFAGREVSGIFALAATYWIVFTTFSRGLDDLVTRQVSREPQRAAAYFANFTLIRFVLAVCLYGILVVVLNVATGYPSSTILPIQVFTLSVIPDSLAFSAQAVLMGQKKFAAPAIVMSAAAVFKIVAGGWVAYTSSNLMQIGWLWVGASSVASVVLLVMATRSVRPAQPAQWRDLPPLKTLWHDALPFLGITILLTFEGQTDIVLLSLLRGESEVSLYNAATTITYSLAMIAQAYRLSIYPVMSQYATQAPEKLIRLHDESLRYLALLAMPMVMGIGVLAEPIVLMIYGPKFIPTILALQLLIPVLGYIFLNVPNTRMMMVHNHQKWNMWFYTLSTLLNIGLNLALDRTWGVHGAATARLCSTSLYFVLSFVYVQKNLTKSNTLPVLARPLLATLAMGLIVWWLRALPLVLVIPLGAIVYVGILWLVGGLQAEQLALIYQLVRHPTK